MEHGTFISLIYNSALLLALVIIFDTISEHSIRNALLSKIVSGLCLGCIALAIMFNPWVLEPGVVFDTRSILLSLTAMFFGFIPTIIATGLAFGFRLWQGGSGVYMGCSVIIASTMWGLLWKRRHGNKHSSYSVTELYSLGLVNHLTMLALTLLLPASIWFHVFKTIAIPVLVIYPIATVFLGKILVRRILRLQEEADLLGSEKQFKALFEDAPLPYQSMDEEGNFIAINQIWMKTMGYEKNEIIGHNFTEFIHPDYQDSFRHNFSKFKNAGHIAGVEYILIKKDSSQILVSISGRVVTNEDNSFKHTQCVFTDITERRKQEAELRSIEWMLSKKYVETDSMPPYGDLTELNTSRLILDSVGKDVLRELVSDYLSLLDTSSAIYEKNGDYAMGIFSSSWCQFLDSSSRGLCDTEDNASALDSGKWLCHESCWSVASKKAIETGEEVDLECNGGIRLLAVPIKTTSGVVGAINMGYGTPPSDENTLKKIAEKYKVDASILKETAARYQVRPVFIIEQAKRNLHTAARIIGEIVERRQAEQILAESEEKYRILTETARDIILVHNFDGTVSFANQIALEFFGVTSNMLPEVNIWDYIPMEFHDLIDNFIKDRSDKHWDSRVFQLELFNKEQKRIQVEISSSTIFSKGIVKGFLAVIRDITERYANQQAIKESQSLFEQFMEYIPGGVFISDKYSRTMYVNKHIIDVFGEHGGVGSIPTDVFPPGIGESVINDDKLAFEKGYKQTEETVPHKDGTLHTYEATKFVIKRDNAEDLLGGIILDITDRKNAEQALIESQSRFEQFMNQIPGNAFIKDQNSCLLYVNKHMVKLFGADAWIGKPPHDIFLDHEAKGIIDDDQLVIAKGVKQMVDFMPDTEGKMHYYETTKFTFTKPDSEILIGGLSLDITEKKLAEEEVKNYTRRLEILHEIDNIVLESLSFESVGNTVLESLHKLVPCSVLAINEIHEMSATVRAVYVDSDEYAFLEQGKQFPITEEFRNKLMENKTLFVQDLSSDVLTEKLQVRERLLKSGMQAFMYVAMLAGGKLLGFISFASVQKDFFTPERQVVLLEITKQLSIALQQLSLAEEIKRYSKELEQKVEERTALLTSANKELESFSYTVAHDLRAPLRSIDGFCTILMEDYISKLDEEAKKLFWIIQHNTHKMDALIKELLELTRLNPYTLRQRKVNMGKIVYNALERIFTPDVRAQFDIRINVLPDAYGDELLLHQVWNNLIGNAIKFSMPKPEKRLEIGSYYQAGNLVYFVKDGGVGFNIKYVDKIFVPFQRLHTESDFEGNGIGLAIVHKIIQKHNGTIWADSAVGRGASFYFSLPSDSSGSES